MKDWRFTITLSKYYKLSLSLVQRPFITRIFESEATEKLYSEVSNSARWNPCMYNSSARGTQASGETMQRGREGNGEQCLHYNSRKAEEKKFNRHLAAFHLHASKRRSLSRLLDQGFDVIKPFESSHQGMPSRKRFRAVWSGANTREIRCQIATATARGDARDTVLWD